jgi:Putative phage tail protein
MSGVLGAGGSAAGREPKIQSLRLQQSVYGNVIPLVYGQARVPGNIIAIYDFTATPHKEATGKGGGSPVSNFTYTATVLTALARGPINAVLSAWLTGNPDQRFTAAQVAALWTLKLGAAGQAPWAYLTSAHPGQDLNYTLLAYSAIANWALGDSANIAQINWEVQGFLPYSATIPDAEPSAIITDFLTNATHGMGFPSGSIASLAQYAAANEALGLFLSPVLDNQRTAADWIKYILDATLAEATWVDGQLQIAPYYDQTMTGNGVTFTPSLTSYATFGDNDFCIPAASGSDPTSNQDKEPVQLTRKQPSDVYNQVRIEFASRGNDYKATTVSVKSQADIDLQYVRTADPQSIHAITNGGTARFVATLKLGRGLTILNQYTFKVSQRWIALRPLDIVTINVAPRDSYPGLMGVVLRITEIEIDPSDHLISITAEDIGVCNAPFYGGQVVGGGLGPIGNPPSMQGVNQPLIVEPTASMLSGDLEIWIALSGALGNINWGGANILMSEDGGTTYTQIGQQRGSSTQGTLMASLAAYGSANPDSTNTLEVDLSESLGTLESVSSSLAANAPYYNLSVICNADGTNAEFLSFVSAAAGAGANQYNLTTLYRGLFGTTGLAHASGSQYAWLDNQAIVDKGIFRWVYPARLIGKTIDFKFLSFDATGTTVQDPSTATAYPYLVMGTAAASGGVGTPRIFLGTGPATGFAYIPGDMIIYPSPTSWAGLFCVASGTDVSATWYEFGDMSAISSTLGAAGTASVWNLSLGVPLTSAVYSPPAAVIFNAPGHNWLGQICQTSGPGGGGSSAAVFSLFGAISAITATPTAIAGPLPSPTWVVASEVPAGAHSGGDAIIYPTVTPGAFAGKICTASGTRGTWSEFLSVHP